ncbi:MAG: discoidin domain-containing protein, partial [Candidatus Brocadiales bacterium]|nr:discoidin domain-containing protein [Candidatus Brocadiales bacterium]
MLDKHKLLKVLPGIILGVFLALSYFHALQRQSEGDVGPTVNTAQGILPILAQYPHKASSCYQKYYSTNLSDNNPDSFWHVAETGKPAWVVIDFGTSSGDVINSFQALPRKDAPSNFWHKAVLQGSNNARYWTNLADVSVDKEPASAEWFTWHFDSKKRYRYYRLFITSGFSQGKDFVAFAEWKLNRVDTLTVPSPQLQRVSPAPFLTALLASLNDTILFIAIGLLVALSVVSFAVLAWIAVLFSADKIRSSRVSFAVLAWIAVLKKEMGRLIQFFAEHGKVLLVRSALIASVCLAIAYLAKLAGLLIIGIFAIPVVYVVYGGNTAERGFLQQLYRLLIFNIFLTLLCFSMHMFFRNSPQREYAARPLLDKNVPSPAITYKA